MKDQRRHQRIRFQKPPLVRIGKPGAVVIAELENLSLGALVFRCELPLSVGETVGCEFVLFDSPLIEFSALVVSRIGDLCNARFQAGPLTELLIAEALENALAAGKASLLSINDVGGRKVMRVAGALSARLHNDFMHGLFSVRVVELDLAEVSAIDAAGVALCQAAVDRHGVAIVHAPPRVLAALAAPVGASLDESLTLLADD